MCSSDNLRTIGGEVRALAACNAGDLNPAHQGMALIWQSTAELIERLADELDRVRG